ALLVDRPARAPGAHPAGRRAPCAPDAQVRRRGRGRPRRRPGGADAADRGQDAGRAIRRPVVPRRRHQERNEPGEGRARRLLVRAVRDLHAGGSPLNATLLTWRRHAVAVVLALVFLGANLGFFLWYRATTRLRASALEKERAALASDVAGKEQEARRLVAQRDRIAGVAEAIQEFYGKRVGGRRETLAPVVDEMHGVFQKVGVFPSQISYS